MQENQPMQTAYLVLSNSGIVNFDWNLMVCEGWVQLDTKVNYILTNEIGYFISKDFFIRSINDVK